MKKEKLSGGVWGSVFDPKSEPGATSKHAQGTPHRVGALRGGIEAVFHTREASMLITGRSAENAPTIRNLYSFAKKAQTAYEMSAGDDPFADYLLLQIEAKDEEVRKRMREDSEKYHNLLAAALTNEVRNVDGKSDQAYELSKTESSKPLKLQFRFNLYASRVLYDIVQFDQLVVLIKSLMYRGVVEHEAGLQAIREIWAEMRGLLSLGHNYVITNCRRKDLLDKNRSAIAALQRLGGKGFFDSRMFSSPEEICEFFAKVERPKFAPAVRTAGATEESDEVGGNEDGSNQ